MKRAPACVFISLVLLVLAIAAGAYFVVEPRTLSGTQELASFPSLSLSRYIEGTLQTDFEQALKDQFVLHDQAIALTTDCKAGVKTLSNTTENQLRGLSPAAGLVPFGEVYRMYGTYWLSSMPYVKNEETVAAYKKKAEEINAFASAHPEAKCYVYYCTRAEDLPWFDATEGLHSFSYSALLSSLLDPSISFSAKSFSDFRDFCAQMYRTDHHWNAQGAYSGYEDILAMMAADFPVGAPRAVQRADGFDDLRWMGSRYRESGVTIAPEGRDSFVVNQFDLPAHESWFGDTRQVIGLAEDYAQGQIVRDPTFDQYLNYYGFESKPIRLSYGDASPAGTNLLIVGDSFARALREPLASHFGETVYVNFRILGETDLSQIMAQYEIGAVLFMGQQDAWSGYYMNGEGLA